MQQQQASSMAYGRHCYGSLENLSRHDVLLVGELMIVRQQ